MASKLKILVWEGDREGEPTVEVTAPTYLAKWADRFMKFVPRKTRDDLWGEDVDLSELNLEALIKEAIESGETDILEVKAKGKRDGKDVYVKVFLDR